MGEYLSDSALTQFLPNRGKSGPGSLIGSSGSIVHMGVYLSHTGTLVRNIILDSLRERRDVWKPPQNCSCSCLDVKLID